jgi:DNA-binding PadR family transcriptional regulator
VAGQERTRRQEVSTTEGAVLALLATEGEHSGYELAYLAERALGHVWSPARSGLYATLPRLAAKGLLESRPVVQATRPDKRLYRISAAGREALSAWLEGVQPGGRDTFFLKLFAGRLTTPDVLRAQLEQFRSDGEARLAVLREMEAANTNRGHDWFHRHLLVYGIRRAELELAWADEVLRAFREQPMFEFRVSDAPFA